ncbi:succinylglutamate desuccinylase/aspartoacylase family protein [Parasphingopyxis marina]|uniref:Succinylglutamate desuccinylase/aspartoacylase family protein n=1 Tax=Parasphingopyxis marina TaxID=2761622 RepID=A0A842HX49_9SPHN|nr:succinylglutamate desuccinylase/aspartoacylase family protein [Parasphingopyxis marina]MBC2776911.1 succinylglutamate desuccinylase/aspartoacylase family protein [Parasphingopyxis marina]
MASAAGPKDGKRAQTAAPFEFAGETIAAGTRGEIELPISRVSSDHLITLPVRIVHGKRPGPVLFVSAGIHGDEITGVEVIRRLLKRIRPGKLAGTLLCVPIVNVLGFVGNSRYLPDRRDLNRCFPGAKSGSLAGQLASTFRTEIIARADFGIDLHSAAIHRTNLPQLRISPDSPRAHALAAAFSPPAIIVSPLREKSLRATALETGVEMLLYEAGEALRFDDFSIRVGVNGIVRVMAAMDMLSLKPRKQAIAKPVESSKSLWIRAPRGGSWLIGVKAGRFVQPGAKLGIVANPVGLEEEAVTTPIGGIVIGHSRLGVVNQGDALVHIAELGERSEPLDEATEARLGGAMLDEDEIV